MKDTEFKCTQCGAIQREGQNFCGECGHKLENLCPACDAANPPTYKFCGQCGKDLRLMGGLTLDRTGLITELNDTARTILQDAGENLRGKPFSIFVGVADRASFYTRWNIALSTAEHQTLEADLKLQQDKIITTRLALKPFTRNGKAVEMIHLDLEDITDRKRTLLQLEATETLLDTIGSLTVLFHPANRKSRQHTINAVLQKIGSGTGLQAAFVSRIDRVSKLILTEFKWHQTDGHQSAAAVTTLPFDSIHPVFERLQNGLTYTIEDCSTLDLGESRLWQRWLPDFASPGSIACELIYREHHPVGIIGLVRTAHGPWPENIIMLMQLSAQLISETFSKDLSGYARPQSTQEVQYQEVEEDVFFQSEKIHDFDDIEAMLDDNYEVEGVEETGYRMDITPISGVVDPGGAIPVFATDDGVYAIQCPKCEQTELVPANQFEKNGWILSVTCSCNHSFRIIREMRKMYRKQVYLPGSFGRDPNNRNNAGAIDKWSAMKITNISKSGLNFTTPISKVLQVGDNIHLKFNLDNSAKSLINKTAMIKSVRDHNVGCQFKSNGKQDTTLGFYFL